MYLWRGVLMQMAAASWQLVRHFRRCSAQSRRCALATARTSRVLLCSPYMCVFNLIHSLCGLNKVWFRAAGAVGRMD